MEAKLDDRLTDLGEKRRIGLRMLLLPMAFLVLVFFVATYVLFSAGIGIWGVNIPVAWGFAIITFVWWVGIGHAGTFISAILLLLRQDWRNSINRLAESMTLLAVACAGVYPILHLGKPWLFYWLLPYPNRWDLYPQYRSPLVWDAFAITTYALVSLLFWYVGMIPDLAVAREKGQSKIKRFIFSVLSLGWSGEMKEWATYKRTCMVLAILATPLVISVHSVVSLDFAVANVPRWHSPFFPPYFVSGAIYSGFAMMLVVLIIVRRKFALQDLITAEHLDKCAKFMLISGSFVTYCYLVEFFVIWYGEGLYETKGLEHEATGPQSWIFWSMLIFNSLFLQLLWFTKLRRKELVLFIVSLFVLVGMWFERYVIVVMSLGDSFLDSRDGSYIPTIWDWLTLLGTLGIFFLGLVLVMRFLPFIPITEIKEERSHGAL